MSRKDIEAARDVHLLDQELAANEEWFRTLLAASGATALEDITITDEGVWCW